MNRPEAAMRLDLTTLDLKTVASLGGFGAGNSPSGGFVTDSGTHLDSLKDKHCV